MPVGAAWFGQEVSNPVPGAPLRSGKDEVWCHGACVAWLGESVKEVGVLSDYPIVPSLPVADLDRARRFYREKLGFEPVEENLETGEVTLQSGDSFFFLYQSEFAGTNEATAAAWRVEDLEETMRELRDSGVEFEEFDLPGFKTVGGVVVAPDGTRAAWFKDSEGNTLAIDQLPS
jgi:catechol 2,3-dioxygenase-like lactoylglutathione lyase family enzyme